MKPFLLRVLAAVLLALGGVLTGYLLVAGERNELKKQLDAASTTCEAEVTDLSTKLKNAQRDVFLRDAVITLHQAQRDLASSNYGLATSRLDAAKVQLSEASEGALDTFVGSMDQAKNDIDEAKALVDEQDDGAGPAIDQIIVELEPK